MRVSQACSMATALAVALVGAACSSGGYGSGGFGFAPTDGGPNFDGGDGGAAGGDDGAATGGGADAAGGEQDGAVSDAVVNDAVVSDATGGVDVGTGGGTKGGACTPGGNTVCSQTGKEVLACSVQTNVYVVVETCEGWCTYEAGAAVCGFEEQPDVVVNPPEDAGSTDAGVPEECPCTIGQCGVKPGCPNSCGGCAEGLECLNNECVISECTCPVNGCGFLPGCPSSCGVCPAGQSCQNNVCTGGSTGGGDMGTATQLFEAWNACLSGACLQESGGMCASGDTSCIQSCVQSANQTSCKAQFDNCSAYDLCPALASCISGCDSDQACIQGCAAGTTGATCVELKCGQYGDACDNNSACSAMFDCFGECPDGSTPCVQACFNQAGSTAQGIYQQLVSCAQDAGCIQ